MADKETMNKTSSISFTLPISCQVCLGKVKQPVVCPNYHAFCSTCIELWLQHNQQCPTCRIPITPEQPCKQILGGPNFSDESADRAPVSTPALRRTRFDLLYKEYEDEIQKLSSEVDKLKNHNGNLQQQLSQAQQASSSSSSTSISPSRSKGMKGKGREGKDDTDVMLSVASKLKQADEMYEKVKQDMDKMKEVNLRLRDENSSLLRETGRLKQLVVSRSPHKYEKYAMSAQASKIDNCEREIKQLKRALDRSDIYTEELENKGAAYKKKYGDIEVEPSKDISVISDESSQSESAQRGATYREDATASVEGARVVKGNRRLSTGKAVRVKREVVDDDEEDESSQETDGGESSFQLDKPSPITPASGLRRLTLDSNTKLSPCPSSGTSGTSTSTASSTGSVSSLRTCTRQLNFGAQPQEGVSLQDSNIVAKSEPSNVLEIPNFYPSTLEDTPSNLDATLSNLDYSITPEFEACTQLLRAAEERVHQRRQASLDDNNSQEFLLGLQPGSLPGDFQASYILADCDPTFQFNHASTSQASTSNAAASGLAYEIQSGSQRPPSAPAAASTITNPSTVATSHSAVPSTRPKSAPLNITPSSQTTSQLQYQTSQSNQHMLSRLLSNPVQGLTTSAYLPTPQTCNSYTAPSQQHLRNTPVIGAPSSSSMSNLPNQSQVNYDMRSRGAPKQQNTVYVLSGSRIAPLGERRKRSSDAGRSQHLTSSPSKTQKF